MASTMALLGCGCLHTTELLKWCNSFKMEGRSNIHFCCSSWNLLANVDRSCSTWLIQSSSKRKIIEAKMFCHSLFTCSIVLRSLQYDNRVSCSSFNPYLRHV